MTRVLHPSPALLLAVIGITTPVLHAQQSRDPRIGYLFPAGAQQGTTVEVTVGGQYLDGTQGALVSGSGVHATLLKYYKPLSQKRLNEFRDYIEEARKKLLEAKVKPAELRNLDKTERVAVLLKEAGATDDEIKMYLESRKQRSDPKRQPNPQLSETLTLKVEIAPNAPPGTKELRVLSTSGVTNPLSFTVGSLPELTGSGQAGKTMDTAARVTLPAVLNGWIPPGIADHYAFEARRGEQLVIAAQARDLTPYLADAVPGWFQPVITLYDPNGGEVACADHFRFSPDPVLCCDILKDGIYLLEIRDALYRGREDFVYRITVGEIPFVTGIFPLGGRPGAPSILELSGWNLTRKKISLTPAAEGVQPIIGLGDEFIYSGTVFAADDLPQIMETEPNNEPDRSQFLTLPVIVNGRLDPPGDEDVFAVSCRSGEKVAVEISARRLNSPVDSWLKVTDATGRQIASNDDFEDKGAGLLTHSADSRLTFTAPAKGLYYIRLGDAQVKGGPDYSYRLRISEPMPDFALRIVPSCINARPGATVPVTLYALRKDGFNDDVSITLKDAPTGFQLDGGWIPAGQDKVRATLTFPPMPLEGPTSLAVEGQASNPAMPVARTAVAADDRMQAFIYHHLVPTKEFLVVTTGNSRGKPPVKVMGHTPIKLPAGGTTRVTLSLAGGGRPLAQSDIKLQLNDPPDGISIEAFSSSSEGLAITFKADRTKVKPGLKGNLIVEMFSEPPAGAKEAKNADKKRSQVGTLPAISFEVTGA